MCLSGCFSLESEVSKTSGEEHVVARNYGWKLFNLMPLVCGNANNEGKSCPIMVFRDDVTLDKVQGRVLKLAASKGREAQDLCYHNYDTVLFNLPVLGFSIPVPYVLTYKEIQLSGVMK